MGEVEQQVKYLLNTISLCINSQIPGTMHLLSARVPQALLQTLPPSPAPVASSESSLLSTASNREIVTFSRLSIAPFASFLKLSTLASADSNFVIISLLKLATSFSTPSMCVWLLFLRLFRSGLGMSNRSIQPLPIL